MAKQPNKLDDQIQQQLKERNRAVATIEEMSTRVRLVDFAARLNKHPHLADLIDVCLDKCINEHLINKNAYKLRPPLPEDVERVDLRRAWLRADPGRG